MISIESEEINFELSSRSLYAHLRITRTEFSDLISARHWVRLKFSAGIKFVHARKRYTFRQDYIDGDENVKETEECLETFSFHASSTFTTFITFQETQSFSRQVRCVARVENFLRVHSCIGATLFSRDLNIILSLFLVRMRVIYNESSF